MTEPLTPRRLPELRSVPHAIPYQGSKRQLAHAIVALLPADTATLLEPFAGSAAVSIAARHAGLARAVHLRDVNEPLVALWRQILDRPAELADAYAAVWQAQLADPRGHYTAVRDRFNATGEPHLLLYLLARCVKAAVRYNRDGAFNQAADNRRLGARPAVMRRRLLGTARTLAGAALTAGDYRAALLAADPADVAYLDPPYQGVSSVADHRYLRGLDRADFLAALAAAVDREVSFLLSYDGATGAKSHGRPVPAELGCLHLRLRAGTSAQATLHGRRLATVESLYLSPALVRRLGGEAGVVARLTGGALAGSR